MLTSLTIKGFRSIKEQQVRLAPLTVLYGPTASGKSSLLYALLVLRNIISNPNEPVDSFFSLGFANLGGFEECIFNHRKEDEMHIGYSTDEGQYSVILNRKSAQLSLIASGGIHLQLQVTFPYALNQEALQVINQFEIRWNGITGGVTTSAEFQQTATEITRRINHIVECARSVDIAPHRRGFFKPYYSPIPISSTPITEDELATLLITDPYLVPTISVDLENITGRDFRYYTPPGSSLAYLQTTDKQARVPCNLANEGFGVNQLVYMLAKVHRSGVHTLLIEEPEIHLHPTIMRRFARRLCKIIVEEQKQVILTTHSEVFVGAVLAWIARGKMPVESVQFYLVEKEGKQTVFRSQEVTADGQIEEGMKTFMEGELEDISVLLGM